MRSFNFFSNFIKSKYVNTGFVLGEDRYKGPFAVYARDLTFSLKVANLRGHSLLLSKAALMGWFNDPTYVTITIRSKGQICDSFSLYCSSKMFPDDALVDVKTIALPLDESTYTFTIQYKEGSTAADSKLGCNCPQLNGVVEPFFRTLPTGDAFGARLSMSVQVDEDQAIDALCSIDETYRRSIAGFLRWQTLANFSHLLSKDSALREKLYLSNELVLNWLLAVESSKQTQITFLEGGEGNYHYKAAPRGFSLKKLFHVKHYEK